MKVGKGNFDKEFEKKVVNRKAEKERKQQKVISTIKTKYPERIIKPDNDNLSANKLKHEEPTTPRFKVVTFTIIICLLMIILYMYIYK